MPHIDPRSLVPLLLLAAPLALATACGDDTKAAAGDDSAAAGTTYYGDVQPLLAQHCTRCHQAGGLGPGDFTDPDTVDALAPAMLSAVSEGRMPPPVSDPGCRDYVGSANVTVGADLAETLQAWLDEGQARGTAADAPEVVEVNEELEDPDIVLRLPAAYTPTFDDAQNPGNEYRCFLVDPGEASGKYITAMAPVLGERALVHHVVLATVGRDELGEAYRDPAGWNCIDGQGATVTDSMITAWAPGMLPVEFPEGVGMQIAEDQLLIVQMHYFYSGPDVAGLSDQSGYAFKLADAVDKGAIMAPLAKYDFAIPAGEGEHVDGDAFENTYAPINVLGMFPHMHTLGRAFDARIVHEDGSETCLVQGDYDFNNQLFYQFQESARLDMGDSLEFSCTWDNTEGEGTVRYGERTDEEMCYFFTLVTL